MGDDRRVILGGELVDVTSWVPGKRDGWEVRKAAVSAGAVLASLSTAKSAKQPARANGHLSVFI